MSEQLMKSQEECANLHARLREFEGSNRRLEAKLNHQTHENQVHVQEKVELEVRKGISLSLPCLYDCLSSFPCRGKSMVLSANQRRSLSK